MHPLPPHLKERPCKSCHHTDSFVKGVFWGTLIGGILGILFAPEKGEETRKKLKKLTAEYKGKGESALVVAKGEAEKAKVKYEQYKQKADPYIEAAREKISEIEKTIEREKGPTMDKIQDFADTLEDEAKKIKKKYFKGIRKR
jgi:gas vesicle protein